LVLSTSKDGLISTLKKFFQNAKEYKTTYLYYSGHGDGNGNWVLETSNGIETIEPRDILY
jgi:hypothetical protein